PVRAGEPRVDDEEHHDAHTEGRDRARGPPEGDPDDADGAHRRGAQHAGLRVDEHRAPGHRGPGDGDPRGPRAPPEPATRGHGRTATTNPAIAAPVTTPRAARGARTSTHSAATHATTIAKCPPETAVTCVSDVVRIAASSAGSSREVSPTATPGTRPRACGLSPSVAPRSPWRIACVPRRSAPGCATTRGGPSVRSTVRSPWCANRPVTTTVAPYA